MRAQLFGQCGTNPPNALKPLQAAKSSQCVPISDDSRGKRWPDASKRLDLVCRGYVQVDDRRNGRRVGRRTLSGSFFLRIPGSGFLSSDGRIHSIHLSLQRQIGGFIDCMGIAVTAINPGRCAENDYGAEEDERFSLGGRWHFVMYINAFAESDTEMS
jgi:hypothetical protein